jgi:hypothetical protein
MARAVNLVWNYCNELSGKIFDRERRFAGAATKYSLLLPPNPFRKDLKLVLAVVHTAHDRP